MMLWYNIKEKDAHWIFSMTVGTDTDGKYVGIAKELTGIKVNVSRNGTFICFSWKDDEDKSISCDFRIVEDELRKFLDNVDLKHGDWEMARIFDRRKTDNGVKDKK